MPRPTTRPMNLSDYRSVLATSGELEVGAYARRMRRKRRLLAAFGVVLIAGAGVLGWALWPKAEAPPSAARPTEMECITCHLRCTRSVAASQTGALECPKCNERSLRQLWKCRDCSAVFLPDESRTPIVCPKCNGSRVGSSAVP